ncbi:hypothetical protein [Neisseria sp. Ec49-e6-T10]|uniref:hypothetical protein n=1 Tax=Neisseria sp. Ec49-e6-T10 TaxID=3140744 RepID=UPI003EC12B6B
MSLCSILLVENEDKTINGLFCGTPLNEYFIFDFFNHFFEYEEVQRSINMLRYVNSCFWHDREYIFEYIEGNNLKTVMDIADKKLPPSDQKYIHIFKNNLWHRGIYNNDVDNINFSIYAKHQKNVKISKHYTRKTLKELIKQQDEAFFKKVDEKIALGK